MVFFMFTNQKMTTKIAQLHIYSGCNCCQELSKRSNKHVDEYKRRDTANHLVRYDCKGFIDVNLDCTNGFVIHPNPYLTDIDKWICFCKYFLTNRFVISSI